MLTDFVKNYDLQEYVDRNYCFYHINRKWITSTWSFGITEPSWNKFI